MTKDVAHLLEIPPFSLPQSAKEALFFPAALELTRYHSAHCEPYANILSALEFDPETIHSTQKLPFLPSGLFKSMRLNSTSSEQEYARSLTSSGTTGSQTVHVELDRETSADQQRALAHIAADSGSTVNPCARQRAFRTSRRNPGFFYFCPAARVCPAGEFDA